MFASKASTQVLRSGVRRTAQMTRVQPSRGMAGGKYVLYPALSRGVDVGSDGIFECQQPSSSEMILIVL